MPMEAPIPALRDRNDTRTPTTEKDRGMLLRDLGKPNWKTSEEFKAAHEQQLKRCYEADPRNKNRNIFHWLASKLSSDSLADCFYLRWLVELVLGYDADIITQLTTDNQKENCLHVAVKEGCLDLVGCLCNAASDQSLKKALSQRNSSDETCLHLVINSDSPWLDIAAQLLDKADSEVIAMQRSGNHDDDKSGHLNTVLHDLVHIDRCFEEGYMEVLKRLTQDCPKAMKIQNGANETPLQFHLRTRNDAYPKFRGLEFSNPPPKMYGQDQGPSIDWKNPDEKKQARSAARAGQHLLNEAFSQPSHEDACACIYGDSKC